MPKIVVLEADCSLCDALKNALVSMGHTVDCAHSVLACLTLLNDNEYDLLITDFFMTLNREVTLTSGASVIIAVRYCDATAQGLNVDPSMPIIVMSDAVSKTASADPLDFCAALGASGTIRKPLKIDELKCTMDQVLCA